MKLKQIFILSLTGLAALIITLSYVTKGAGEDVLPVINTLSSSETSRVEGETPDFPAELNMITRGQLEAVPGIGPSMARNIIEYREKNGPFRQLEDLLGINGIGWSRLEALSGYLFIDADKLPPDAESEAGSSITAESEEETRVMGETPFEEESEPSVAAETEERPETAGSSDEEATEPDAEYVPDLPIELNSASLEDLIWLNGIGEVIARRIIEYADTKGFYAVEDLLNVKGIGEAKLRDISEYVYADPGLIKE